MGYWKIIRNACSFTYLAFAIVVTKIQWFDINYVYLKTGNTVPQGIVLGHKKTTCVSINA